MNEDEYSDDSEYRRALKRDNRLQQTNYVIPPDKIMQSLHVKTHYKGAQSIISEHGSMKI